MAREAYSSSKDKQLTKYDIPDERPEKRSVLHTGG